MNALRTLALTAAVAASVVATSAHATTFRNLDSLVGNLDGGGQLVIALDISCRNGGNFAMETDSRTNEKYRGCAYRDGGRVLVEWNDGSRITYSPSGLTRTTSWMRI